MNSDMSLFSDLMSAYFIGLGVCVVIAALAAFLLGLSVYYSAKGRRLDNPALYGAITAISGGAIAAIVYSVIKSRYPRNLADPEGVSLHRKSVTSLVFSIIMLVLAIGVGFATIVVFTGGLIGLSEMSAYSASYAGF